MKKSVITLAVIATFLSASALASDLKTEPSSETNIIKHKKGWASALTVKGDRGIGLYIDQGNKKARGIKMDSGNASVTMSPSYVAGGVPNTALPYSSETAAVVFNVEGAKLNGDSGTRIVLDAKSKAIYWIQDGIVVAELVAKPYPSTE